MFREYEDALISIRYSSLEGGFGDSCKFITYDLSNACPPVLVSSITAKIRALNSTLYKFLQETKSAKFASLVDTSGHTNDSHSNAPVSDRAVVTISDDLPVSDAEKSFLSN